MDTRDKLVEIRKKTSETSIYIGRVPKKTKTEFMKLSETEFESDYGMCLKWLIDYRRGLLSDPNEELGMRIDLLAEEVNKLKVVEQTPPKKEKRKMLSGKEL